MKVVIEYAVRFDNRPVELWRVAGRIVHRIPSIAVASIKEKFDQRGCLIRLGVAKLLTSFCTSQADPDPFR
jgi:hypothetical protein